MTPKVASWPSRTILLLAHSWHYRDLRPYNVGLHLSQRGYNVHLLLPAKRFSFGYKVEAVNERLTLYFCPTILPGGFKKGSDPVDLLAKLYLVRTLKYDLIIAFDSRPTVILPAAHGKGVKRVPLILDWTDWFGRGGIITERSGKLYRFFFERIETFFEEHFRLDADNATVICAPLAARLRGLGYQGAIHDFPLGCDPVVVPQLEPRALREILKLPVDVPLVGCVGTLLPADAALLFESFDVLTQRTPARLVLIGDNKLDDESQLPAGTIRTRRVSRTDLYNYIHCCDAAVLPLKDNIANNGRWPSKLNDYLVMGKPVVSTETSVVTELMKIARFGLLAKDTPQDFGRQLHNLLTDSAQREACGREARRLASGHLSWERVMDGLEECINETLRAAA